MRTKIMGVLNVSHNSFFESSRMCIEEAQYRIETMIQDGADIIDIGAVSTKPGSEPVEGHEEFEIIKGILEVIRDKKLYDKAIFSIDSSSPLCIDYAFCCGFKIANDINGIDDIDVCKAIKKHDGAVIIMHKKGNPRDMQNDPTYEDVLKEVDDFFEERIERARGFGIMDITLDVGIGFGKSLEHNISLIKNHARFLRFGYPMLIGASRKSMIDAIYPSKVEDRLPGTLAVHLEAVRNGASIVRCHDVKEHKQAIKIFEALT